MNAIHTPILSIVTICKNRVSDIRETCESVIAQTWQDFQWIIVDGNSNDGTMDIVKRFQSRVNILLSESDNGVYNAMNKGIRHATGEYILFLHGGDRLASPAVLDNIFRHTRYREDIVYGDELREFDGKDAGCLPMPDAILITKHFFVFHTLPHQSTFIRRELFFRYGMYDEIFKIVGDWEKWIVFFEEGCSFKKINMVVSIFKMGGMSSSAEHGKLHKIERTMALERHFSADDIAIGKKIRTEFSYYRSIKQFGVIADCPLFRIEETPDGIKRRYVAFGVPFLKIRKMGMGKLKFYLFGFIPI